MGKEKSPRRVADNEALSVGTQIRGSAQKLGLVAALIRGRSVEEALNILTFSTKGMAVEARKAEWMAKGLEDHWQRSFEYEAAQARGYRDSYLGTIKANEVTRSIVLKMPIVDCTTPPEKKDGGIGVIPGSGTGSGSKAGKTEIGIGGGGGEVDLPQESFGNVGIGDVGRPAQHEGLHVAGLRALQVLAPFEADDVGLDADFLEVRLNHFRHAPGIGVTNT